MFLLTSQKRKRARMSKSQKKEYRQIRQTKKKRYGMIMCARKSMIARQSILKNQSRLRDLFKNSSAGRQAGSEVLLNSQKARKLNGKKLSCFLATELAI